VVEQRRQRRAGDAIRHAAEFVEIGQQSLVILRRLRGEQHRDVHCAVPRAGLVEPLGQGCWTELVHDVDVELVQQVRRVGAEPFALPGAPAGLVGGE